MQLGSVLHLLSADMEPNGDLSEFYAWLEEQPELVAPIDELAADELPLPPTPPPPVQFELLVLPPPASQRADSHSRLQVLTKVRGEINVEEEKI
jgi:hypothetical protein